MHGGKERQCIRIVMEKSKSNQQKRSWIKQALAEERRKEEGSVGRKQGRKEGTARNKNNVGRNGQRMFDYSSPSFSFWGSGLPAIVSFQGSVCPPSPISGWVFQPTFFWGCSPASHRGVCFRVWGFPKTMSFQGLKFAHQHPLFGLLFFSTTVVLGFMFARQDLLVGFVLGFRVFHQPCPFKL